MGKAEQLNENWIGVRDRLVAAYRPAHLPLFANYGNRRNNPEFIGSCVFAVHDELRVLLTCGHVTQLLKGRQLTTLDPRSGKEIKIVGEIETHCELDLSVIRLSPEHAEAFSFSPIATDVPTDADWVYIEGYPKKHNDEYLNDRSEWTPVGLRLRVVDQTGDRAADYSFPPTDMSSANKFVEFSLTNFTDDNLNDRKELFRPRMMSGSPIYLIGKPKAVYECPNTVEPKLVGIFEEHWKDDGMGKIVLVDSAMNGPFDNAD